MPWLDLTGNLDLDLFGTTAPAFVDGPAGPWLDFDGVDQYASGGTPGAMASDFLGLWTIEFWMRIRDVTASAYPVVYGADVVTGGAAADSTLFFATVGTIANDKELVVGWEAFGVLRRFETGIKLESHKPYLVQVKKIVVNADRGVEVWINGGLAYTTASGDEEPNANGGSNAVWWVGGGATGTTHLDGNVGPLAFHATQRTDEQLAETWRRAMRYDLPTAQCVRVDVKDGAAAWVTLDDLPGGPWVRGAAFGESRDSVGKTAQVKLMREQQGYSMSPLVTTSRLNQIPRDHNGTFDPLLDLRRGIRIYAARVPVDTTPDPTDWELVFDGKITLVDVGGRNEVTINARDNGAELQSAFIKVERDYSVGTTTPMETVMQSLLDDNVGGITLEVPEDPNADLTGFTQRREPLLTALKNIARRIGWDVRWAWSDEHSEFRLTLQEINRENPVPDGVLSDNDYKVVSSFKLDVSKIRTNGELVYPSNETVDPAYTPPTGYTGSLEWYGQDETGAPLGSVLTLEHDAAVARYGDDLFFSCIESESSLINTAAEAERFMIALLDDMGTPDVEMSVTIEHVAFEIGLDFFRLLADGVHTTDHQQFAIMNYRHTFDASGGGKTTLGLRGKPSLGADAWLSIDARGGSLPPVTSPLQHVAGRPVGERLQNRLATSRGSLIRSTQGRKVQSLNPSFSVIQEGPRFPPTDWELLPSNGPGPEAWGVNWNHETSSSQVISGGRAVRIDADNDMGLKGKLVEVSEGEFLEIEVVWQVKEGATTRARPQLFVDFFDETFFPYGIAQPPGGWAPGFLLSGPTLPNGYQSSIFRGQQVPVGQRFARPHFRRLPGDPNGACRVDSCIIRTMPRAFRAYRGSDVAALAPNAWHTANWDTENYDYGAQHDTSTGIFTCQKSGRYGMNTLVRAERLNTTPAINDSTSLAVRFLVNGTDSVGETSSDLSQVGSPGYNKRVSATSAVLFLNEGDTVEVQFFVNGGITNHILKSLESFFSVEEILEE